MIKNLKTLLICGCVFFAHQNANADTVILTNGDRITGQIADMTNPGGLAFNASFGQQLNMPWYKVAGLMDGYNRRIALPPQIIAAMDNRPAPSSSAGTQAYASARNIQSTQAQVTLSRPSQINAGTNNIQTASPLSPETKTETAGLWGAEWSGRVNAGASLQKGNSDQSAIGLDGRVQAEWKDGDQTKHRASLEAEYNREERQDVTTEDNRSLDAEYDYFFKPKWFANASLGLEQDELAELDLRSTLGAGLGYQPYKGKDLNLKMVGGPTYLREEFENGSTDSSLAARWALDYDQRFLDTFQAFHNHEIFVPGNDTNAYVIESATGLRLPIKNGIVGTAQIDYDWDNDPEPSVSEEDTKYSAKIGYEW